MLYVDAKLEGKCRVTKKSVHVGGRAIQSPDVRTDRIRAALDSATYLVTLGELLTLSGPQFPCELVEE